MTHDGDGFISSGPPASFMISASKCGTFLFHIKARVMPIALTVFILVEIMNVIHPFIIPACRFQFYTECSPKLEWLSVNYPLRAQGWGESSFDNRVVEL